MLKQDDRKQETKVLTAFRIPPADLRRLDAVAPAIGLNRSDLLRLSTEAVIAAFGSQRKRQEAFDGQ